jgi:dUTP pyrophosphatase
MRIARTRDVKLPTRGTDGSAGIDFYVPNDYPENLCTIEPGERFFIPSGVRVDVPVGCALIAFNKSGIALNKGLDVGACVVDSDYQGEVHLHLFNTTRKKQTIVPGDKVVQFLLMEVDHDIIEEVSAEDLFQNISSRGSGGFGSTGEK